MADAADLIVSAFRFTNPALQESHEIEEKSYNIILSCFHSYPASVVLIGDM